MKNDFLILMYSPGFAVAEELPGDRSLRAVTALLPEFRECGRAFLNWSKYILNAFDVLYSNGCTEICGNKTRVLKRVCFGVRNLVRLRSRIPILFRIAHNKKEQTAYRLLLLISSLLFALPQILTHFFLLCPKF